MNGGEKAPEAKVTAAAESGDTMNLTHAAATGKAVIRRNEVVQVVVRLLTLAVSVASVSFMVTSRQDGVVIIYGFYELPISAKWSYSNSFVYVVAVTAAAAAYSLLQLIISGSRLLRKTPIVPSRKHGWLIFAADQIFAYAMMSAGSAASGTSDLNRTGVRHTVLPNFCKAIQAFCNHVAISIAFAFFGCVLLAMSALQDVIWLIKR